MRTSTNGLGMGRWEVKEGQIPERGEESKEEGRWIEGVRVKRIDVLCVWSGRRADD